MANIADMGFIPQRKLGHTGVIVSRITFGTMRLTLDRFDLDRAACFLEFLLRNGVTSFHSSAEYESFDLFRNALEVVSKRIGAFSELQHIVKLPEPHFGYDRFDSRRFERKVEEYLRALNTERLDVVQWMLRYDLQKEQARRSILQSSLEEIGNSVESLRRKGKIGTLMCFPYTICFAEDVVPVPWCSGLVAYFNSLEQDYAPVLDSLQREGKSFIAIRPLAAGKVLQKELSTSTAEDRPTSVAGAIQFALSHPAVVSAIVSPGTEEHAAEVFAAIH